MIALIICLRFSWHHETVVCRVQNEVGVTLIDSMGRYLVADQTRASLLKRATYAEYEILLFFLLPEWHFCSGDALGPNSRSGKLAEDGCSAPEFSAGILYQLQTNLYTLICNIIMYCHKYYKNTYCDSNQTPKFLWVEDACWWLRRNLLNKDNKTLVFHMKWVSKIYLLWLWSHEGEYTPQSKKRHAQNPQIYPHFGPLLLKEGLFDLCMATFCLIEF